MECWMRKIAYMRLASYQASGLSFWYICLYVEGEEKMEYEFCETSDNVLRFEFDSSKRSYHTILIIVEFYFCLTHKWRLTD